MLAWVIEMIVFWWGKSLAAICISFKAKIILSGSAFTYIRFLFSSQGVLGNAGNDKTDPSLACFGEKK